MSELILLTVVIAIASVAISYGAPIMLAVCGVVTVVAFRTSVFDFTAIGNLAVLATMLFGLLSIAFLVLWSAGF